MLETNQQQQKLFGTLQFIGFLYLLSYECYQLYYRASENQIEINSSEILLLIA